MQEPIKTLSIFTSSSFSLPKKPIYSKALFTDFFLSSSLKLSGVGTLEFIGNTSCGLVPHVTDGIISSACNFSILSNFALSSDFKDNQNSFALSQLSSLGAIGLPLIKFIVFSSGATKPALAPASIDILQIVILSSIERFLIVCPAYSMT